MLFSRFSRYLKYVCPLRCRNKKYQGDLTSLSKGYLIASFPIQTFSFVASARSNAPHSSYLTWATPVMELDWSGLEGAFNPRDPPETSMELQERQELYDRAEEV